MTSKEQVYENLRSNGLEPELVQALVDLAISEDLMGGTDVTSLATIPEIQISELDLVTRSPGVIAGINIAALVFLSVNEISGTNAKVRDTRKTTPGLRLLEKYAVKAGGGTNHRMSLNDQALIKDNHIVASGSIKSAVEKVKDKFPELDFEIEVDNLDQLNEALAVNAKLILLDNFNIEDLKKAVVTVNKKAKLEASGGITLENARKIAETGVDFLAVGALTHSAPVLDIGGDLRTVR